jgi:penicillin-binding protein 2
MRKIKFRSPNISRFSALALIMVAIIFAIIVRLVFLQIVNGEQYLEKANNKSIKEIPVTAPRGNITDINGKVLATSVQSYTLVFNPTDESDAKLFDTMKKVFKILDANGEKITDDFELKVEPYSFEFLSDDTATKRALELRFKKDRGMDEAIKKKLYNNKTNLSTAEQAKVNEELLKITPEETFNYLVKQYKIDTSMSLADQRRYMIMKDTEKMQSFSGYKSVTIASGIKQETAFIFLQQLNDLPGIDVTIEPIRTYPNGELGSAFLGYISKISSNQDKYTEQGYDVNTDLIGMSGIESAFEDRLKGSKGAKIVKLNTSGRIIEVLGEREASAGQNIQLTINSDVQAAAESTLDKVMAELQASPSRGDVNTANATRGCAIAINVKTGAIVALASRPGYDPNIFSVPGSLTSELYQKYFNPDLAAFGKNYILNHSILSKYPGKSLDQVLNILFPIDTSIEGNTTIRKDTYDIYPKPFYNYATQAIIPPGSTFKPLTAIAGLEEGVITPSYTVTDTGTFDKSENAKIHDITKFAEGANGTVDLTKALEVSSNPYFMTVGRLLKNKSGADVLASYAWKFGLGVQTNSDVKASTGIEIAENFGQVFNSWSAKNIFSTTNLWQTMSVLKSGQDPNNNNVKFMAIDLYDNANDSDDVKNLKTQIKNDIKDCIKNGSSSDKYNFRSMINSLIAADPQYNVKLLGKNDLDYIVKAITSRITSLNSQISNGSGIYDASIGQGISNFTPLQLSDYIATIANGGTRYKLHLVNKITDADGNLIEQVQPQVLNQTGVSQTTINAVKAGLKKVTGGEDGTAASAFTGFGMETAGKTGSATFSTSQEGYGRTSYALFLGYAPANDPEIAVCVVVFDGGHGAYVAPVARAMYEAYFKTNQPATTATTSTTATQ